MKCCLYIIVSLLTIFMGQYAQAIPSLSYTDFLAKVANNLQTKLENSAQTLQEQESVGNFPDIFVQVGREGQDVPMVNSMKDNSMAVPPNWVIGLSQEFPWPKKLASQKELQQANVALTTSQNKLSKTQRLLDAADYYVNIILASQVITIKKEALVEAKQVIDILQARRQQGLNSHADTLAAQTELELLRNDIATQETEVLTKKQRALWLADLSPRKTYNFDTDFSKELLGQSKKIETTKSNEDGLNTIYNAQLAQKLAGIKVKRLDTLPALTTSLSIMRSDAGTFMFNAMLGIKLPIFSSNIRLASDKISEINTQTNIAEQNLYGSIKELALLQWEQRVQQAQANLQSLDKTLLPLNQQHVAILLNDFSQGKTSLLELNQARKNFLKLREARVVTQAFIAQENLRFEKIMAGLAEDTLELPIPKLSAAGMDNSAMPSNAAMSSGASKMKSDTKKSRSSDINAPRSPANNNDSSEPSSSGGGMGM